MAVKPMWGGLGESIGHLIGDVVGWLISVALLMGLYAVGTWLARQVGAEGHREAIGLIAAGAFVWMYEHRLAADRWERLRDASWTKGGE